MGTVLNNANNRPSSVGKVLAWFAGIGGIVFLALIGYQVFAENSWATIWQVPIAVLAILLSVAIFAGRIRGL